MTQPGNECPMSASDQTGAVTVDHMLVLEGPQGKSKSEALRTLAVRDAWYTDRLSHVASKDAAQEMAGVWLIEIAEMDALTRAAASEKKAFLTRRSDRFRPPLREASDQATAPMRLRRDHQSAIRRIPHGSHWRAPVLACCMSQHD